MDLEYSSRHTESAQEELGESDPVRNRFGGSRRLLYGNGTLGDYASVGKPNGVAGLFRFVVAGDNCFRFVVAGSLRVGPFPDDTGAGDTRRD